MKRPEKKIRDKRQWYPSEKTHHLIFISEHLKGNLNAPLFKKPTVNIVSR